MTIKYDVDQHQTARQYLRDARKNIDRLPEPLREWALNFARKSAEYSVETAKAIHAPYDDFYDFNSEVCEQLNLILFNIVLGTLESYRSIYQPITDPNLVRRAGSDSDYETDKKALEEIVGLFSKSRGN